MIDCAINSDTHEASYKLPKNLAALTYTILYKDPCTGEKTTTGIEVTVSIQPVVCTRMTFIDESTCASMRENIKVRLELDSANPGKIDKIIMKNADGKKFPFVSSSSEANGTKSTVICGYLLREIPNDSYFIDSVQGELQYEISSISSVELIVSTIGIQRYSYFVVTPNKSFSGDLTTSPNEENTPVLYANADDTNPIQCRFDLDLEFLTFYCQLNTLMQTPGLYELYFKGKCEGLTKVGMSVQVEADETNIVIIRNATWIETEKDFTSVPVSGFKLTITPSYTVETEDISVTLFRSEDKSYVDFPNCSHLDTEITCAIPDDVSLKDGTYYISVVRGAKYQNCLCIIS